MIILAVVIAVVISVVISYFVMVEAVKRSIDFAGDLAEQYFVMVEAVKRSIDFAGDLAEQSNDFTYDVMKSHIDKWHKGD